MKLNKNEELKSRRDFFKKAAKSALPIIGAVVLANSPLASKAAESMMSCNGSCSGSCKGACSSSCSGSCSGGCTGSCTGSCKGTCVSSSSSGY